MTLTPYTIEGFGGLNLTDDPLEVGTQGAVDMKNIWLTHGRIQTAPTIGTYATATRAVNRLFMHKDGGGGTDLLVSQTDGTNTTLQAFNGSSSIAATTYASVDRYGHSFASIGTSSATRAYAVRASDVTRKWNGAAWSTVAGIPQGDCCAPADGGQRLAVASGHRVWFSAVGDPESFNTADPGGDWVDISPGDGETICALVQWGNLLFAFKNTKYAIFYGNSVDADGGAVFNFRMVDVGIGIGPAGSRLAPGTACAGRDGVYFISPNGIYRTVGGPPEMVSRAISPVFKNMTYAADTTIPRVVGLSGEISAVGEDIFVSLPTYSSSVTATFILHEGQWLYWDIQANGASNTTTGNFVSDTSTEQVVFVFSGSTTIKYLDFLAGPSSALAWSYKSGRYSFADPGVVAVSRESSLVGSGTVALRIDSDLYTNQNGSATLGTAPATAEGWPANVDQEGTWLQHTLSGTGKATVSRLTHYVQSAKPVGVR